MNKIELLCPAGNIESFKAACQNGADAIYMGVNKFNARTMAQNFNIEEYIKCIKYAHMRQIKVFLTLNTLVYNSEIKEALEIVLELYSKGLDAVIVQDIGLATLIHKLIPDLPLHASTQMSVYSLEQVKFLEELGFRRVVLARELTIDEIEYICKNSNVEIEVFVHGALCVSFSGQCLFSSTIGNRSANRGNCAQPCRKKYSLYSYKDGELVHSTYLLSKKDILGIDFLRRLHDAGVYSFKLEGRNKTPEYVAGITYIYRKSIDKYIYSSKDTIDSNKNKYILKQLFNRNGQSTGYLDGVKKKESITLLSPKNMGLYLGEVLAKKGKLIKIKLEEDINLHDGFEVYLKNGDNISSSIITCIKDKNLNLINKEAKKGDIVYIGDTSKNVPVNSKVYKTSSNELNRSLRDSYINNMQTRKVTLPIELSIKENNNILACYYIMDRKYEVSIDYTPEKALTKSLSKEQIVDNFSKTKDIPYNFNIIDLKLDDGLFIPLSKLNFIRKEIYNSIESLYNVNIDIKDKLEMLDKILEYKEINNTTDFVTSLYINSYKKDNDYLSKFKEAKNIYVNIVDLYRYENDIYNKLKDKNICLCIPNVTGKNIDKYILSNLETLITKFRVQNIVLGSYKFLNYINSIKNKYNLKLIADFSLNITNVYSANFLSSIGFDELILTGEQDIKSIINISKVIRTNVLNGQICVMTSRYCVLGSFLKGKTKNLNSNCTMPCVLDNYYLKDSHDYNYDIACDNIDCIMRILRYVKAPGDIKNVNIIKSI